MTSSLKANGKVALLGAVLIALVTIFGFLGAVPWEPRGSVATLKSDVQRELTEIKADLREVLRLLRQDGRHVMP